MKAKIIKTSDSTIYIHDDECDTDMNAEVQNVAGIIFDVCRRKAEESQCDNQAAGDRPPQ